METRARKRRRLLAAITSTSTASSNSNSNYDDHNDNNFNYNHHVPTEITENVLVRLPPRSLIKFQSLSKHFSSLITDTNFITANLKNHCSNQPNNFILILTPHDPAKNHPKFRLLGAQAAVSSIKTLPFSHAFEVVGSCNGLLCMSLDREATKIVLWNPTTRQLRPIPKPSAQITQGPRKYFMLGFGFETRTQDYKVVRVVTNWRNNGKFRVQVFSLATNSWTYPRNAAAAACLPHQCYYESLSWKSLDGVLYWFGLDHDVNNDDFTAVRILAFDLRQEMFSTRVVQWNKRDRLCHQLVPLKASSELTMVEYFWDGTKKGFNVWMMNGSDDMSWKEFGGGTVPLGEACDVVVVGVWRDKDIDGRENCYMLLRNAYNDSNKLRLYKNSEDDAINGNKRVIKEIVLEVKDGIENYNLSVFNFVQSLVPVRLNS